MDYVPISVVITAMVDNERPYLLPALNSVRRQTVRPLEIRIYVSENNSWAEALLEGATDVTLCKIPMCNAAVARNIGCNEAQGEWIAYLDVDDYWLPTKLADQWQTVQSNPNLDLVVTDYYFANPDGKPFAIGRCLQSPPSTWLVRASFLRANLFDPAYATGQDVEWLLRTSWFIRPLRVRKPLAGWTIRPDSRKSKPWAPEHKMHRNRLLRLSALGKTPLRSLVVAITYIRYLQNRAGDFWTVLVPEYVKAGEPTAVKAAEASKGMQKHPEV